MNPVLKLAAIILLAGLWLHLSCKKELSCENCLPGSTNATNKPPLAKAGADQIITLPKDSVAVDGSASSDPDGSISNYAWTKVSGPASFIIVNSSASITTIKNLAVGTYLFELKVTDNGGLIAKDTVGIIVDAVSTNHPPVANAGADQTITLPVNTATLNGSASTDPDNDIASYNWTKISGPSALSIINAFAVQTQLTSLVQGAYQFELKVTDSGGLFSKDTVQITVNDVPVTTVNCPPFNRPLIPTQMIPFGTLSIPRSGISIASAGNKILFAGGSASSGTVTRVDIYDLSTQAWTTAELSAPRRSTCAIAAGNKIFFAGGYVDPSGQDASTRVDIYDVSSGAWTTAELSIKRFDMAAATVGTKVFFAGGQNYTGGTNTSQTRVDIYDLATNTWTIADLSEPRSGLTATAAGNKIYFAGGLKWHTAAARTAIDIYDATTGNWAVSSLSSGKAWHGSLFKNNKIYWFGGLINYDIINSTDYTCGVEIRDVNTGATSSYNLNSPTEVAAALEKDNNLVVIGFDMDWDGIVKFDIYNTLTNTWSVGQCPSIPDASFISVNNTIYVAGGRTNSFQPLNAVWKLDF